MLQRLFDGIHRYQNSAANMNRVQPFLADEFSERGFADG